PIFTFVNKCDRPGEDPLKLLDDVEAELGIRCYAVTWPIVRDGQFAGVYDRVRGEIHLFGRSGDHGQTRAAERVASLDDPQVRDLLGGEAHDRLLEEIELLSLAGAEYDAASFEAGDV